jgi:hypothetical protein
MIAVHNIHVHAPIAIVVTQHTPITDMEAGANIQVRSIGNIAVLVETINTKAINGKLKVLSRYAPLVITRPSEHCLRSGDIWIAEFLVNK